MHYMNRRLFLDKIFNDTLERNCTDEEYRKFEKMNNKSLLNIITNSNVYKTKKLNDLYKKVLKRPIDDMGLKTYLHMNIYDVEEALYKSDEYKALTDITNDEMNESKMSDLLVLLQIGNLDTLINGIIPLLKSHQCLYDVIIATNIDIPHEYYQELQNKCVLLTVKCENIGMDIGMFFQTIMKQMKVLCRYKYFIKLHTKSNIHMFNKFVSIFNNTSKLYVIKALLDEYDYIGNYDYMWNNSRNNHNMTKNNGKCVITSNASNINMILKKYFNMKYDGNFEFCEGTIFAFNMNYLNMINNLNLESAYSELNVGRLAADGCVEHAWERIFGIIAKTSYYIKSDDFDKFRISAIYFPQFHYFQENDHFWGSQFTEWTLMNKKKQSKCSDIPIMSPHKDIGYYNLSSYNTRKLQGKLAKNAIDSFCIYHYWFSNKAIMDLPLQLMMNDNEPNINFFLCWANESWCKKWDGIECETSVLLQQTYNLNSDEHYHYLLRIFNHRNYVVIENKPIFSIYKIDDVPLEYLTKLNDYVNLNSNFDGIEFRCFKGNFFTDDTDVKLCKYVYEFAPLCYNVKQNGMFLSTHNAMDQSIEFSQNTRHKQYCYGAFRTWSNYIRRSEDEHSSFDIISDYEYYDFMRTKIAHTIRNSIVYGGKYDLLYNAWNEWNEQAILEPDDLNSYTNLDILKHIRSELTENIF